MTIKVFCAFGIFPGRRLTNFVRSFFTSLLAAFLLIELTGCSKSSPPAANTAAAAVDAKVSRLEKVKDAIVPFYRPMKIQKGDWLETQPETGETFEQYIATNPTLPTKERRTIYIQPIGDFTEAERKVIGLTADYMKAFFDLPVKLQNERQLGSVPPDMTRKVFPNNRQIRTTYFLENLLPKLLPKDAAALICLTNFDLYPGETWGYVFGQASFVDRVGVWSLWRFQNRHGKPDPKLFLSRTLKVAMHETGHMFSMRHCTKYECLMSGTNHILETDRRPLDACPECMAKIAWAMNYDPVERYEKLEAFWQKQDSADEAKRFSEMAAAARKAEAK